MSKQHPVAFDRTHVRQRKHEAILRAAVMAFNETGFNGTSIEQISQHAGVSKRTIYNYIKHKEDLVYQCYRRNLETNQAILTTLASSELDGATRVRELVCQALSTEAGPGVVIAELHSLSEHHRRRVRAMAKDNRQRLTDILEQGIADGSIRACDSRIVCYAILSVISWVPLWFSAAGELSLDAVGQQFADILINGLARCDAVPTISERVAQPTVVSDLPGTDLPGAFDRNYQSDLKRTALINAATAMFNDRGIAGTSLDDIAAQLEVTKGALYYYFANKAELLFECYWRTLDLFEAAINAVERATDDPLSCLVSYIKLNSITHASNQGPMMVFVGLDHLSADGKRKVIRRARQLERRIENLIVQGVEQGTIRTDLSPVMARFVIAGMLDWFPKWYRPDGRHSAERIANEFVQLAMLGLVAR